MKLIRKHRGEKDATVIVTSTYNGQPPDNAANFSKWLDEKLKEKKASELLSGSKFAVLGVGNSQWATFQAFPRKVDAALESLGAQRCMSIGEVDVDGPWEESFLDWRTKWLTKLVSVFVGESSATTEALKLSNVMSIPPPTYTVEPASCPVAHGGVSSSSSSACPATRARSVSIPISGAQPWKILSRTDLQSAESDRRTLHIEMKLPEGVTYEAGDHLGICPRNSLMKVQALARTLFLYMRSHLFFRPNLYSHVQNVSRSI
jgi:cytochrome P450 / NADPH-cytochrome P450 reductase